MIYGHKFERNLSWAIALKPAIFDATTVCATLWVDSLLVNIHLSCCRLGYVAAIIKSHMNGLKPFERTIKQTTETMPLDTKRQQLLE